MKVKRGLTLFLALVFALSVFLVGCGSKTTETKTDTGSTKTNTGGGNSSTAATGQPLNIVATIGGNWQDNFNPFSTSAMGGTNGLIYQPMYYLDTVSTNEYPFLATKYEWINDNKTLEVTLRDGVKWSDGQPFTADDVMFTFNLLKKYPAADTSGIMKEVTSFEKKSDNVIDFNFSQPNVPFGVYILQQPIVPQHIWKDLGDPSKAKVTNPVGTGPYMLDSFTPQDYKLKKNPKYYDADSYAVPELNYPAYDSNESAQLALVKGDIDWTGMFIPNVDKVYVDQDKDHNHYWFPPSNPVMLYPNLKNPILKDINVRKAISMAIDRNKISQQAEDGYAQVANPTGMLPQFKDFIDPKYKDAKFTVDDAGAIKLLQDAGYKKGSDGIFVSPTGKKLSFTLQVVSGWSDWVTSCMVITQDLKKIGIQVKVQQPQYGAYMTTIQGDKYDLAIGWTNGGPTPYKTFQDLLNSHGAWNIEKYSDPATDAALAEYQSTTDPAKQKEAMSKIEDVMVNQLPAIPLFYGPVWFEYSSKKYTGFPDQSNTYSHPSPYSWPAPAVVLSKLKPVSN
ncbi:ABC transporter substrate-binding protein [Pullulanibacillus sp. KACC 23026]|uniref:ABC transporter substrate-binding protein n=1 Tax=Pullulanibacillus sp. KACC 23026 TaxID=3028315 RepID=UPI0023AF7603|nr:ABC transporter substrate-binding protein [Pullulanibacillus sp. KACC 23026]WEG11995.1 ABC transporter substrate-binding protein [Pullulanibacillus sp. KACC 23026]